MTSKPATAPWPSDLLLRPKVNRVFVCGRGLEPPLFSYVVNFSRLEVPLSGCYENQIETDRDTGLVQLKPGDALFAPPNCWNLPTWRQPVRLMSVLFGKKQIGISIVTSRNPDKPRLLAQKYSQPRPLTGAVSKILDAMIELQATGQPNAPFPELARALLHCLGAADSLPTSGDSCPAKSLLEEACIYLQNHYQYDVTRESVAQQFGISPNYLSRIFQMQGHMTFSSYLMHVRTDRAKHLLRSYDLKLDDIAARCGYHDTAYFCRVFKKLTKTTPAEYRSNRKVSPFAASAPPPPEA